MIVYRAAKRLVRHAHRLARPIARPPGAARGRSDAHLLDLRRVGGCPRTQRVAGDIPAALAPGALQSANPDRVRARGVARRGAGVRR